jgi:hypothetical protein
MADQQQSVVERIAAAADLIQTALEQLRLVHHEPVAELPDDLRGRLTWAYHELGEIVGEWPRPKA